MASNTDSNLPSSSNASQMAPTPAQPAVPPKTALGGKADTQGLVQDLANGKITPDQVYSQYSAANNSFTTLNPDTYNAKLAELTHPDGSGSIHRPFTDPRTKKPRPGYTQFNTDAYNVATDTKERLYIHAKADHAPQMMQHIANNNMAKGNNPGVTAAKIWGPEDIQVRKDGIVVYTNGPKATDAVSQSLEKYRETNPTHFGSDAPLMTKPLGPGIGKAADPKIGSKEFEALYGKHGDAFLDTSVASALQQSGTPSFGQVRSDMIGLAAKDPSSLTNGKLDPFKLQKNVDELFAMSNVNPQKPWKNLQD